MHWQRRIARLPEDQRGDLALRLSPAPLAELPNVEDLLREAAVPRDRDGFLDARYPGKQSVREECVRYNDLQSPRVMLETRRPEEWSAVLSLIMRVPDWKSEILERLEAAARARLGTAEEVSLLELWLDSTRASELLRCLRRSRVHPGQVLVWPARLQEFYRRLEAYLATARLGLGPWLP